MTVLSSGNFPSVSLPPASVSGPVFSQPVDYFDPATAASAHFKQLVAILTPEIAATILREHHGANRTINKHAVQRYRDDIEAGVWGFVGDPLKFDTDGLMMDGQHRLTALSQVADKSLEMRFSIQLGMERASMGMMDQGHKRTAGNALSIHAVKNSNGIAAAARVKYLWDEGKVESAGKVAISAPLIEQWVLSNMALVDHINLHMRVLTNNDATNAASVGAAMILAEVDPVAEVEFFTALADGGQAKDSPITVLDKKLAKLRRDSVKYSISDQMALIFRAWNAWRKGKTLTRVTRPGAGESFPVPM